MAIEINGMAHVILTVSRFKVAREFYRRLLPEFGMKVVFDGDRFSYCVGARLGLVHAGTCGCGCKSCRAGQRSPLHPAAPSMIWRAGSTPTHRLPRCAAGPQCDDTAGLLCDWRV